MICAFKQMACSVTLAIYEDECHGGKGLCAPDTRRCEVSLKKRL